MLAPLLSSKRDKFLSRDNRFVHVAPDREIQREIKVKPVKKKVNGPQAGRNEHDSADADHYL
jgi:hypothetical protein